MGISLTKAPGGALSTDSAYASCELYFDGELLDLVSGNYAILEAKTFTFNTSTENYSAVTPYDFVSSFVDDLAFGNVKPFLEALFDGNYSIALKSDSGPESATLIITAINPGAEYNFTSFVLPPGVTAQNIVTASGKYCYPVFSKNDYDFIFSTTSYITNAGTKSVRYLNVSGKPIAAQHLVLSNGIKEFDFVFTTDSSIASTTPLRILTYTGSETNLEQANAIISALRMNYYIDTNYELSIVSFVSGVAKIKIEGRLKTIPLINATTLPTNVAQDASFTTAIDTAFASNYRFFCDVLEFLGPDQYNKLLELDAIPTLTQAITYQEITRSLTYLIPQNIPDFGYTGVPIELGNYLKFILKVCDYFGESAEEKLYTQLPAANYFLAINGAASALRITDDYLVPYFTYPTKWLTGLIANKATVSPAQKQFLSAFIARPVGDVTVTIRFKIYYTDGTYSESLGTSSSIVSAQSIVTIGCGYNQLNINALKESGKTVIKYEVWLEASGEELTERFTFIVDQTFYRNSRYFLFINSFGQPEVIWLRGARSRTFNTQKVITTKNTSSRDESTGVYTGSTGHTNIVGDYSSRIASGSRQKWELDYIIGFISSEKKFEILSDKYMEILLTNPKTDIGTDDDSYFTFEFEYSYADEERGNA